MATHSYDDEDYSLDDTIDNADRAQFTPAKYLSTLKMRQKLRQDLIDDGIITVD